MSHVDLESLARRAVACAEWRWMPGMLEYGYRVLSVEGDQVTTSELSYSRHGYQVESSHTTWAWGGDLLQRPDLDDPATLGCLLALVREKWGPLSCVIWDRDRKMWAVYCHMAMTVEEIWQPIATGATEAEALVVALEVQNG